MSVLANNLIAIRNLTLAGLDSQALTLARSHFELLAIVQAVALDEQFFKDYVEGPANGETELDHWRKINNKLKKIIREYYEGRHPKDEMRGIVDSIIYRHSHLSLFVHSQYIAIVQSTHYRAVHKPKEGEVEYALGGIPCHESKSTVFSVCSDTWMFLIAIRELLFSKHGWQDVGKNGSEALISHCLISTYIASFVMEMPAMHDEVQEIIKIQREAIRRNQNV
jgi:hypothetical protein